MKVIDIDKLDIDQIPRDENENFEFKSSKIKADIDGLKNKLGKAVSGFANSGGGCFIVGIDEDTGNIDGGIPLTIGRTPLKDWVDKMIHQLVEPTPSYTVKLIKDAQGRGTVDENSAVLIVYIFESHTGPHMMDGSYYIRAGAHTLKARDFLVEAIRAKRFQTKPKLTHLFRFKPNQERVLQLGIISLTETPAINVSIRLSRIPEVMRNVKDAFPIEISFIDRNNPFFFDVALFARSSESFGNDVELALQYEDLLSNKYNQNLIIGVHLSTPPIQIGNEPDKKIVKAIESLEKSVSKFKIHSKFIVPKPNSVIPVESEKVFNHIENIIPELVTDIQKDLIENPVAREFMIGYKERNYLQSGETEGKIYYYEDHPFLRNKLRILENCNLIYEIASKNTYSFAITEQFANYLLTKQ